MLDSPYDSGPLWAYDDDGGGHDADNDDMQS